MAPISGNHMYRYPGLTLQASGAKGGQHFGLFLDGIYVCDYMCKMGGCVEYN